MPGQRGTEKVSDQAFIKDFGPWTSEELTGIRARAHPGQINARTYSAKYTSGKNKQDRTGDKGGGICFAGMRGARQEKVNADV